MALNKQRIDIRFDKGVNTKLDNKSTIGADLLKLENRVFSKIGTLNKRNGYSPITVEDNSSNTITNLNGIFTYQNDQLVLVANNKLYSYSESNDMWVEKDDFIAASADLNTIIRNNNEQSNIDSTIANGLIVYAYEDTRGGIRYSIQDEVSKSFIINDSELTASGDTPKCVSVNNNVFIFYGDGTDLKGKLIVTGNPTATPSEVLIRSDLDTGHIYDFTVVGVAIYCFSKRNTAGECVLSYIDSRGVFQQQQVLSETVDDVVAITSYTDTNNTDSYLNIIWKQDADTIKAAIYERFLVEYQAPVTIDATVGLDVEKITATRTNNTTDQITIFYHVPHASNDSNDYIRKNTLDLDGTVGSASVFIRSVGIATKAFNDSNGNLYIGVLHESSLQSTVFILDSNANVICKYAEGFSGSHANLKNPTNTFVQADSSICFIINTKGRLISENNTLFSLQGISKASVDFSSNNTYNNISLNNNLFIAGGILSNYDGHSITEQGFHLYPEDITNSGTSTSGGSMSDGTYQYIAVYEWTDNVGNLHRSAPSVALTVSVSGGGSTQTVDIDVPTLRITKKTSPRSEVSIALYRTEDAGTLFYKVTSITSPTDNDPSSDSVTITDTLADSSIISNELLYTTGGVLDNISAPSCDIVTSHNNRLWLAGLPQKNTIRYSKTITSGNSIGFNEALDIQLEPTGGDIKQLASMDSNLIIFKLNNIYTISGTGPNNTGANNNLTEPQLITTDTGCKDSNSVILGPDGLYFKSAKGIYLLDRGLSTTYIGSPVEAFNDETITSSQLLEDINEIRFTTNTGTVLVYNYYFKQWSTFTEKNITDSVIWQNKFLYIDTDDLVYQEDTDGFLDNNTFVSSNISTGWINLTGLQGYQRVSRLSILGEFKSNHKLRVRIYNDYSSKVEQEVIFETGDILSSNSGFYGDGIYGSQTVYGGTVSSLYQFQVHIKKQKCQALRVEIEDIFDNSELGSNTGEGMNITGISVLIGTKQGLNKTITGRKG